MSVRPKRRPAGLPCVVACVVALAGCGSSATSGGSSVSSTPPYADVVIDAYGAGLWRPAQHVRLVARCTVSGALVAGDAKARGFCRAVATQKGRRALEAPTPGAACSMIYGGPAQVRLSGTIAGERVDVVFSRANGCEIARYDALFAGVVPPATGLSSSATPAAPPARCTTAVHFETTRLADVPAPQGMVSVPDLASRDLATALAELTRRGLRVSIPHAIGPLVGLEGAAVAATSPRPGAVIEQGSVVTLAMRTGGPVGSVALPDTHPQWTTVPDLVGLSYPVAAACGEGFSLLVTAGSLPADASVAGLGAWVVESQSPPAGTRLPWGASPVGAGVRRTLVAVRLAAAG